MTATAFGVLGTPGARMVVYTPADDYCSSAIDSLIAGDGADARFPCWPHHQASAGAAS
jgi:hypothetical protein